MQRHGFSAMGTTVTLLLPADHDAGAAAARVEALFEEWETRLSRFRSDSELTYVNHRAGGVTIVSPLFFHVLQTALAAARATNGVYDPTLFHQLLAAGYDRSFELLDRSRPQVGATFPGGGWRSIRLDPTTRGVFLPAGVGLDFGGIAKGMAVDASIDTLTQFHVRRAAVEAGGDLRVLGLPPQQTAWPVAVETRTGHEVLQLRHGGLATSSVGKRRWGTANNLHHLIDPGTGRPSETDIWSASVAASTCAQAEVAAKAVLLLGARDGCAFLVRQNLYGLIVRADGTIQRYLGTETAA